MNQRFQNAEIKLISEQYAENELYKAVNTIGLQLENELKEFGLCPEECFMETLELLSEIADKGEEILPEIENFWLRKENEYRRYDRQVSVNEIRKSVGIVFGFAILAINSSRHWFYRYTLTEQLMQMVATHKFDGWQATLDRIFSIPLPDGWFDAFIDEELQDDELPIPQAINNDKAQIYFRKAIDKGYMDIDGDKFVWHGVGIKGEKSQLAYFLGRIYGYKHSTGGNMGREFQEEELNKIFGEKRLYSLLTQAHSVKRIQSWRYLVDELFE